MKVSLLRATPEHHFATQALEEYTVSKITPSKTLTLHIPVGDTGKTLYNLKGELAQGEGITMYKVAV